jgi:hypothetical protein
LAIGDHSHALLHAQSHNNDDHTGTYIEAAGVTYENLDSAGDVGTGSGQVAIGDHGHGLLHAESHTITSHSDVIDATGAQLETLTGGGETSLHTHAISDAGWTYGSQVATNTGTTRELTTSIAAGATEIEVMFNGVSLNGTGCPSVQLGDAGGYEESGYAGTVGILMTGSTGASTFTTGFYLARTSNLVAGDTISGVMRLVRWDTSEFTWHATGIFHEQSGSEFSYAMAGTKATSHVVTSIRLNTNTGSLTFDAGEARVRWR